ncbi:hypothetical protein VB779_05850 [Haloarculaceae archaeon H-GB11]|nr:hypothetical protein [Haloarculaceae archaeon H-GB11]
MGLSERRTLDRRYIPQFLDVSVVLVRALGGQYVRFRMYESYVAISNASLSGTVGGVRNRTANGQFGPVRFVDGPVAPPVEIRRLRDDDSSRRSIAFGSSNWLSSGSGVER